ncbi:uncharacterized protein LOC118756780 isoform X1 [Rhagoletis pomonella]|uniref:uncharacterized protein LOC118756780 isoform X1 n=1 Tax=Rhagoletis pomonella TaxID=28610 RepID=UPI001786D417|nr:uncharacterized protein LOC118756780 isoform X1 [Rhagoletis pomonella]
MITDKDFILTVKLYPELYNKNGIPEEKKKQQLWARFAQETLLKSDVSLASAAEHKWRQLVSKYVSCLVYGTPFAYEREMQFMQMPLLGTGSSEDTQSDSDIDELELIKVLNSYEDDPPATKRQRVDKTDVRIEESTGHIRIEHKNKEAVQIKNGCSPVLNSNRKQSSEFQDKTEALASIACSKTEALASIDCSKTEDQLNKIDKPTSKDDCGVPRPPNGQSSVLYNISNEDRRMSSSFTNLTSLELIFLGYAKVLQRMPLGLQLQTKRKIANVMDEAELKMYEEN